MSPVNDFKIENISFADRELTLIISISSLRSLDLQWVNYFSLKKHSPIQLNDIDSIHIHCPLISSTMKNFKSLKIFNLVMS